MIAADRQPSQRPGALQLDVSDSESISRLLGDLPRVDALVNNAAVQLFKPLLETGIDEWEELHRVNVRGAWLCLRAVHNQLVERRGSVVNIASVHAVASSRSIGAYATTKGGLGAFTRAAALELAEQGVRVNAILPGAIDTPALRAGFTRRADAEALLIERTPLRRIGSPRDVATLVAFLLDGELSGFMTGTSIPVDGGVLARLSSE